MGWEAELPIPVELILCQRNVNTVFDDLGSGHLGDHAALVPGHALTGQAVEAGVGADGLVWVGHFFGSFLVVSAK